MVQGAFSCPGYPGKRLFVTLAQSYAGTPQSIGQRGRHGRLAGRTAAARQVRILGERRVRQLADTTPKFAQIGEVGRLAIGLDPGQLLRSAMHFLPSRRLPG